jgi:hypothetical protein
MISVGFVSFVVWIATAVILSIRMWIGSNAEEFIRALLM